MSLARRRRPGAKGAGDGGGPARRAVARWAWRLFRREWRQQILVLALLTVAVASAIGIASAAYSVAPVPGKADFGTANHSIRVEGSDPQLLETDVAAAEEWFGTIDVIRRRYVRVPGLFDPLEFRSQDPKGAYGAPMLALREGRYPTRAGEVAVTDWVADTFDVVIGNQFALDGAKRTVIGLVENPSDLDDEFALLALSQDDPPEAVTILVSASTPGGLAVNERVQSFRPPSGGAREIDSRHEGSGAAAALGVLGVATLALFLVSLVAAASFVVVAQRRLRQLGMLAAIGATEKHLRLVMVANGAVIGAVAGVIGATVGMASWIAVVPRVESAVGYRIDRFDVPWWLIPTGMLLAVVTATGAAWWPARVVARTPIVLALSGRPPRPKPAHRSAALAGLLIAIGVVCLAVGGDVADQFGIHWTDALLIVTGTVATVLGVLLIGPLAIRALAGCAARLPVAVRLAVRDLARYQARTGAALAAITLVLGIPVAIVVTAAAAEHTAEEGNLAASQLVIRVANFGGPFIPEPAQLERIKPEVGRIVAPLDDPTVIAMDVARDPDTEPDPNFDGQQAVTLVDSEGRDLTLLYVATPKLLEHHGLDLVADDPNRGVFTVETGRLWFQGDARERGIPREVVTDVKRIAPRYSSLPGSFMTTEGLRQRGWEPAPAGSWLVETSRPLTDEQLKAAREVAAGAGLTIESRDHQRGLPALRSGATAVGMLLALGFLAMTVGLIRGEATGDLRALTAAGATSTIRRALTAATAGALAFLGVALGVVGAYVGLAAGYRGDLDNLTPVPILHLTAIAVGTPLAAAVAGWLLAGREPPALARQPIE